MAQRRAPPGFGASRLDRCSKSTRHASQQRATSANRDLRNKPWDEVNPIKLPFRFPRPVRLRDRGFKPAVLAVTGLGELEITASATGRNVVIGTNSGYANSADFGATFTTGAGATPFTVPVTRGDPSTGLGVTGSFYISYLANPAGGGAGANSFNGCTVPVAASTDGGATWNYRGNARQCSNNVSATSNCFADQEHITADARNAGRRRVGRRVVKADQCTPSARVLGHSATAVRPVQWHSNGNHWHRPRRARLVLARWRAHVDRCAAAGRDDADLRFFQDHRGS